MGPTTRLPARLVIADAHPIVRLGFRELLRADPTFTICGEATGAKDVLRLAAAGDVDLVIADVSLEDGTVLELIRELHRVNPELPVLVFSAHDENLFAERVVTLGARGFIMKSESIDVLVHALKRVLSGNIYVSDRISQRLFERIGTGVPAGGRGGMAALTHRELQVIEMIGRGLGTAAIAEALALSVKTIETHRSRIRLKLGLKDATELIRYATLWAQRPSPESGSQ